MRRETTFLQFAFCFEGLLATGQTVDVLGSDTEKMRDAGRDFIEQGLLRFAEGWFREEFEVLQQGIRKYFGI